jgi:hypothetical protein
MTALAMVMFGPVFDLFPSLRHQFMRLEINFLEFQDAPNIAIISVAVSMPTAVVYKLKGNVPHHNLGREHIDRRDKSVKDRRLISKPSPLGFHVEVSLEA